MVATSNLPLQPHWPGEESYVDSLLQFATSNDIFRNLCGGIHILDFLTRIPSLYSTVLPAEWREWVEDIHINDFLDLLLREDLESSSMIRRDADSTQNRSRWRGYNCPPQSLVEYIQEIRRHGLRRDVCETRSVNQHMPRHVAVGMKPKKVHEVANFASYVHDLAAEIESIHGGPVANIVDFGSGQNYLGRTLASPPYSRNVIAIERKHNNINGAKGMDVSAKLAKKEKIIRNKKVYKNQLHAGVTSEQTCTGKVSPCSSAIRVAEKETSSTPVIAEVDIQKNELQCGSVTYIEQELENGNLEHILRSVNSISQLSKNGIEEPTNTQKQSPGLDSSQHSRFPHGEEGSSTPVTPWWSMVVSLHSCGNLVHHGLRSLILNPSVSAVAMIGCCYNLMTERLGPETYKLPLLRPYHPRLQSTAEAYDPHGFPMSQKFEAYKHKLGCGVRLNITARMMAVQAPQNWGPEDSEAFFTRHFYRALLQKLLLDLGVVEQSNEPDGIVGDSVSGITACGLPLIVGSLRKPYFTSFRAYVRGALNKLVANPDYGQAVQVGTANLTDDMIIAYEKRYHNAKKHLSVIWSLMAFSAEVVESLIVIDRWLFLREQDCVEKCWVEPVFDYGQSPRNLVVVGIKKDSHP